MISKNMHKMGGVCRQVIAEAAEFLCGMTISPNRGDCREGDHLLVVLDPHWNEDGSLRVVLSCRAFGVDVAWRGMPIFLIPETEAKKVLPPVYLDSRGGAIMKTLPHGNYRLAASAAWRTAVMQFDEAGVVSRTIRSSSGTVGVSLERRLVSPDTSAFVVRSFTYCPEWAGAEVYYCLNDRENPSLVFSSGMLILEEAAASRSRNRRVFWEGRHMETELMAMAGSGEQVIRLSFCVIPQGGGNR